MEKKRTHYAKDGCKYEIHYFLTKPEEWCFPMTDSAPREMTTGMALSHCQSRTNVLAQNYGQALQYGCMRVAT